MDWDFCKTFNAVADAGSYLAAAKQLGLSHPTVSRNIAALEAQLGSKLFLRSDKGLALTATGRAFYENTKLMAQAASTAETVATSEANARGVVKVSIGPTLLNFWLMPHVGDFLRAYPRVEIQFVTHPFPVSVHKREADVVLKLHETGNENLIGRKIARLGTCFYASRDYARRNGLPEHKSEWSRHSVIGLSDRASNQLLGRWSDRVTRDAKVVMRCSSQADMLAAARAGVGISALTCVVGDMHPDLVRVSPNKLSGLVDIWLLAHPDLTEHAPVRAVLDFLTACAKRDRARLHGLKL